jgi:hypothetical protein
MEWKWTKGEPYERSRRILKENNNGENNGHTYPEVNYDINTNMEISAYTSSLNHDENTWDILNQTLSGAGFKSSNKREELDTKIADRELVQQRGFNPFLSENNYIDDVSMRDKFLKPMNTSQDRIKNEND